MHLIQTMAYVGHKPWHGLGNQLARQQPIEVWKQQAGMDWKIEESEVRYVTGKRSVGTIEALPENKVLYRSDTKKPLAAEVPLHCAADEIERRCLTAVRQLSPRRRAFFVDFLTRFAI